MSEPLSHVHRSGNSARKALGIRKWRQWKGRVLLRSIAGEENIGQSRKGWGEEETFSEAVKRGVCSAYAHTHIQYSTHTLAKKRLLEMRKRAWHPHLSLPCSYIVPLSKEFLPPT